MHYIEQIITDRKRAEAIVKSGLPHLFYRDDEGIPHNPDIQKLERNWGIIDFFVCNYPNPRTEKEKKSVTEKELEAIREALKRHSESLDTPEKAREYLYSGLGTHNRDGTLCEQYGGEYTDPDHPVHSK